MLNHTSSQLVLYLLPDVLALLRTSSVRLLEDRWRTRFEVDVVLGRVDLTELTLKHGTIPLQESLHSLPQGRVLEVA